MTGFQLWFDVEKRYNTTNLMRSIDAVALWFDVEKRYNTTCPVLARRSLRCGLM